MVKIKKKTIYILIIGAVIMSGTFYSQMHTVQYLECKDTREFFTRNPNYGDGDEYCECNWFLNICYGMNTNANIMDDCIDFSNKQECTR